MRRIVATTAAVTAALVAALLWMNHGRHDWLSRVPPNTLALVVLREMPSNLDFLPKSRLGQWFDSEGLGEAAQKLDEADLDQLLELGGQIHSGWIALHRVERKSSGALRPHLSALLRPHHSADRLEAWLEKKLAGRFQDSTVTVLDDGSRLVEGQQKGQLFYMRQVNGDLVVANSTDAWMQVSFSIANRQDTEAALRKALARPAEDWDLLVFFRGPAPLDLVPQFLYLLNFQRPESDVYEQIPQPATTKHIGLNW